MRRTNARAYYVQAPWTERTDDTPDVAGTKKIDLSSCAFPHDGDWFNEVPDPSFLWRCALAFSPRGLDHAKRRCRDRVAPYFFVTVYIHYIKIICYLPLKVTLLLHPVVSKSSASATRGACARLVSSARRHPACVIRDEHAAQASCVHPHAIFQRAGTFGFGYGCSVNCVDS